MSQSSLTDDPAFEAVLNCGICLDKFKRPKLLQCSHSFCQKCLQKWCRNQRSIRCPLCKIITKKPHKGIANLRDDFRYHQFVECLRAARSDGGQTCGDYKGNGVDERRRPQRRQNERDNKGSDVSNRGDGDKTLDNWSVGEVCRRMMDMTVNGVKEAISMAAIVLMAMIEMLAVVIWEVITIVKTKIRWWRWPIRGWWRERLRQDGRHLQTTF